MIERRGREKVMAFVMAGGEGARLRPLTLDRCKPAVPFGSRYRIIDFVWRGRFPRCFPSSS